jgi:hypothetical protein
MTLIPERSSGVQMVSSGDFPQHPGCPCSVFQMLVQAGGQAGQLAVVFCLFFR